MRRGVVAGLLAFGVLARRRGAPDRSSVERVVAEPAGHGRSVERPDLERSSRVVVGIFLVVPLAVVVALRLGGMVEGPLFYTALLASFYLSRFLAASFHGQTNEARYEGAAARLYEPAISFVIPCKDEEDAIELSVTSSLAADYPEGKLEVIVVDDGSTDRTSAVLATLGERFPQLQVITFEHNRGKREAMAKAFAVPAARSSFNSTRTAISLPARFAI